QALFRKASQFLLVATRGHFYFKDVVISTPKKWPKPPDSQIVWEEQFSTSDVRVLSMVTEPRTLIPDRVVSLGLNPILLPSKFLIELNTTSTKRFGKPGESH
ncbi:unnamed protein product, partial [Ixodes hexagonus]